MSRAHSNEGRRPDGHSRHVTDKEEKPFDDYSSSRMTQATTLRLIMSTEESKKSEDKDATPEGAAPNATEEKQEETAENVAAAADADPTNVPAPKTVTPPVIPMDWAQMACADNAPIIRYPTDVAGPDVWDVNETDTIILVGTSGQKITNLGPDFGTTLHPQLSKLILRSHLVSKMEGLESFQALELLELYDNQIEALEGLEPFGAALRVLDMSYNVVRDMAPVQLCPNLQELCKSLSRTLLSRVA